MALEDSDANEFGSDILVDETRTAMVEEYERDQEVLPLNRLLIYTISNQKDNWWKKFTLRLFKNQLQIRFLEPSITLPLVRMLTKSLHPIWIN